MIPSKKDGIYLGFSKISKGVKPIIEVGIPQKRLENISLILKKPTSHLVVVAFGKSVKYSEDFKKILIIAFEEKSFRTPNVINNNNKKIEEKT
tara:strand:- start:93 stop:371 length:279 start_codon:yes stop_codon:yes gene_type:complete